MEVVVITAAIRRAKLQSKRHHQQMNTQLFHRPDALPVTQTTVSKHWREVCCTLTAMKLRSDSVARALAIMVLEQPGGPYSKWPRGGRQPSRANSSGWRIGQTMLCSSFSFSSCTPPMSDQRTCKSHEPELESQELLKIRQIHFTTFPHLHINQSHRCWI